MEIRNYFKPINKTTSKGKALVYHSKLRFIVINGCDDCIDLYD